MIAVADVSPNNIRIFRTATFKNRVEKYVRQLKEIGRVCIYMQKRGGSLEKCYFGLETLLTS